MADRSRNGKVTVVGAGFYGSTTALRLAEYDLFDTVVLTDIVEGKPEGLALDINQSRPIEGFETRVVGVGGGSYAGTEGSDVVVVGRGITVGRPLGLLLTRRTENATVTLCHTGTRDLAAHTRAAAVLVAAAGVPGLITAEMVKPGAAVLDVGVSRVQGKIAGDVAADVARVAGHLAPNPGGVGPMTRAMLLSNVVLAAEQAVGTEVLSA
jgi:hypothetical protein